LLITQSSPALAAETTDKPNAPAIKQADKTTLNRLARPCLIIYRQPHSIDNDI